jgi:primary-amine oxidase
MQHSEEDAGILHKHTDFRDLRAHIARNRKLVISTICTVANHEVSAAYFHCVGLISAVRLLLQLCA